MRQPSNRKPTGQTGDETSPIDRHRAAAFATLADDPQRMQPPDHDAAGARATHLHQTLVEEYFRNINGEDDHPDNPILDRLRREFAVLATEHIARDAPPDLPTRWHDALTQLAGFRPNLLDPTDLYDLQHLAESNQRRTAEHVEAALVAWDNRNTLLAGELHASELAHFLPFIIQQDLPRITAPNAGDVQGRHVIGHLPPHLEPEALSVTNHPYSPPEPQPDGAFPYGVSAVTYRVQRLESIPEIHDANRVVFIPHREQHGLLEYLIEHDRIHPDTPVIANPSLDDLRHIAGRTVIGMPSPHIKLVAADYVVFPATPDGYELDQAAAYAATLAHLHLTTTSGVYRLQPASPDDNPWLNHAHTAAYHDLTPQQLAADSSRHNDTIVAAYRDLTVAPRTTPNELMIYGTGGVSLWERHWAELAHDDGYQPIPGAGYLSYASGNHTPSITRAMCFAKDVIAEPRRRYYELHFDVPHKPDPSQPQPINIGDFLRSLTDDDGNRTMDDATVEAHMAKYNQDIADREAAKTGKNAFHQRHPHDYQEAWHKIDAPTSQLWEAGLHMVMQAIRHGDAAGIAAGRHLVNQSIDYMENSLTDPAGESQYRELAADIDQPTSIHNIDQADAIAASRARYVANAWRFTSQIAPMPASQLYADQFRTAVAYAVLANDFREVNQQVNSALNDDSAPDHAANYTFHHLIERDFRQHRIHLYHQTAQHLANADHRAVEADYRSLLTVAAAYCQLGRLFAAEPQKHEAGADAIAELMRSEIARKARLTGPFTLANFNSWFLEPESPDDTALQTAAALKNALKHHLQQAERNPWNAASRDAHLQTAATLIYASRSPMLDQATTAVNRQIYSSA